MAITPRLLPFVATLLATTLTAQSGWSAPVLETTLNSTAADTGPNLSLDGLTMYFASFRSSNWEIWSSTRPAIGAPWSAPVQETALGDPAVEDQPFQLATGLEIWFSSSRLGGTGGPDLMRATRPTPTSPWNPPTFVTELNSSLAESAPSLTADGLEVFFYSTGWGNPSGNNNTLFTAMRPDTSQPFGTPTIVTAFLNANTHRDAEVSPDGLSIVFTEFVSPRLKVMYSERVSRTSPWAPPVVWTEFDTVGTSQGVFSFTRSIVGNEAFLAAGFATAAGGQEILRTTYTGISHQGIAGIGSTMSIGYHDPANPGKFIALGVALGNTGFMLGSRHVPLDPDGLLILTLGVNIAGFTSGWDSQLDGAGEAVASFTNALPALVGLPMWLGGITWDPSQPFGVGSIMNSFAVQFQ